MRMRRRQTALAWLVLLLAAPAVACSSRRTEGGVRFPGDTLGLIRPKLFASRLAVVSQVNAIVQADVADLTTEYDDCEGPRTLVKLRQVRTLLGAPHPDAMELRMFGGPLPKGRYAELSESPRYATGGRYLLFLRIRGWAFAEKPARRA